MKLKIKINTLKILEIINVLFIMFVTFHLFYVAERYHNFDAGIVGLIMCIFIYIYWSWIFQDIKNKNSK